MEFCFKRVTEIKLLPSTFHNMVATDTSFPIPWLFIIKIAFLWLKNYKLSDIVAFIPDSFTCGKPVRATNVFFLLNPYKVITKTVDEKIINLRDLVRVAVLLVTACTSRIKFTTCNPSQSSPRRFTVFVHIVWRTRPCKDTSARRAEWKRPCNTRIGLLISLSFRPHLFF